MFIFLLIFLVMSFIIYIFWSLGPLGKHIFFLVCWLLKKNCSLTKIKKISITNFLSWYPLKNPNFVTKDPGKIFELENPSLVARRIKYFIFVGLLILLRIFFRIPRLFFSRSRSLNKYSLTTHIYWPADP